MQKLKYEIKRLSLKTFFMFISIGIVLSFGWLVDINNNLDLITGTLFSGVIIIGIATYFLIISELKLNDSFEERNHEQFRK